MEESFYVPDYPLKTLHGIKAQIPPSAKVSASLRLLPHLAFREKIYYFPSVQDADYILLYKTGHTYPVSQDDFDRELKNLLSDEKWMVMEDEANCILLKRK